MPDDAPWDAAKPSTEESLRDYMPMVLHVTADSARDMYQTGIGAHVSQSKLICVFPWNDLTNTM